MALKRFLNKTGNRFVETGYLPVIGLRDVMCHMVESHGKESGPPTGFPLSGMSGKVRECQGILF